jgi:AraC-like DNA-binding protein
VKRPFEQLLFETPNVAVGSFRCPPDDERFTDTGPSSTNCFVFPRRSVWIKPDGRSRFLSDPTIVTLYNQGQRYTRQAFSRAGDHCYWFAVATEAADEAGFHAADRSVRRGPFSRPYVQAVPALYVDHHRVLHHLREDVHDPLFVEETVLRMLDTVLRHSMSSSMQIAARPATPAQRRFVERSKMLLTLWTTRRVPLVELASRVGCSAFHLCHSFRLAEGSTLHEYQTQLRLRAAVERLVECPPENLSRLALELGFCSHSHFSAAFRRTFGSTPSRFVEGLTGRRQHRPSRMQDVEGVRR